MVGREMGRYWSKRKDGSFALWSFKQKKDAKRKYPKCVPLAKATRMTKSQKASAVRRKRAVGNKGPKPTNKCLKNRWWYLNKKKKYELYGRYGNEE